MPHAVMTDPIVPSIKTYTDGIQVLLEKAHKIKPHGGIEPPITPAELGNDVNIAFNIAGEQNIKGRSTNYPVIETAVRNTFYSLVVRGNSCFGLLCLTFTGIDEHRRTIIWPSLESTRHSEYTHRSRAM